MLDDQLMSYMEVKVHRSTVVKPRFLEMNN